MDGERIKTGVECRSAQVRAVMTSSDAERGRAISPGRHMCQSMVRALQRIKKKLTVSNPILHHDKEDCALLIKGLWSGKPLFFFLVIFFYRLDLEMLSLLDKRLAKGKPPPNLAYHCILIGSCPQERIIDLCLDIEGLHLWWMEGCDYHHHHLYHKQK